MVKYLDKNSLIYKQIRYLLETETDFIANLGHSTFLIYFNGIKILTDPFLSLSLFGIPRQQDCLHPSLLPEIDYLLITHAHYDHLDLKTLKHINRDAKVILPEKCKRIVDHLGFIDVLELENYKSYQDDKIFITSLSVKHNKGRPPFYLNTGLNSYLFRIDGLNFYFLGDSAYFPELKEYGKRFDIDIAFLPIGGYRPRILLKKFHMAPWEAVQAFKDLKAKCMIPIHFNTFHVIPPFLKLEKSVETITEEIKKEHLEQSLNLILPNHCFF